MTTSAVRLFGSTFKWNGVAIAESVEIGFPGINTEIIDVSSEDSTSAFREFIAGMHDGGEFTVDANFIKGDTTGQVALMTDAAAGTARTAIITLYGGATWTVTAICTKVQPSGGMTEQQKISFAFKVTGVPVFAATASAS